MPDKYKDHPLRYSPHFRTPHPLATTYPQQVLQQLNASLEILEDGMSIFAQSGSGWTLEENHALILEMVDYQPIGGSSYLELPKDVFDSKAVINVKNDDQECFKWSVLAALHPAKHHAERISHYQPFKDELNFDGIDFPVTINQISKVEKQNPGISVTLIGIAREENKTIKGKSVKRCVFMPLRVPDKRQEQHITLLLWQKEEETSHYAWVKNLNRLLSKTKSYRGQTYFCERCFQGFVRPDLLEKHAETCQHFPVQATTMVNQEVKFTSWVKTEPTLFRVYADFECILKECEEEDVDGKTIKTQKHIPCSVAWVLISDHPEVESRTMLYRPTPSLDMSLEDVSEQVVDELILTLKELEKELFPFQMENKPMILTEEEEAAFQATTDCYMCEESFHEDSENFKKVRDHNHATGEYRGAAHAICNLNKQRSAHIPVFFHNLRSYDAHLIMQGIHRHSGKKPTKENKEENKCKNIRVIPNNMEKYVSFQLGNLRFLDSLQFLGPGASLDALASNLTEFPHLEEHFTEVWSLNNPQDIHLLCQKGVYPYSYMDSFTKFEETSLPNREAFKNDLTGEDLPEEKYEFAERVWNTTGCQALGDYHDLCLYQDIFLLADIFEKFRQVCKENYQLDPAHYYTVPGLAWDAALKFTKVKPVTLHDIEMHQFLERGMRGGISMITHQYAVANNKDLQEYDPEKPSIYIIYKDANNLYGEAMSQYLSVGDFKWVSERDAQTLDVMTVADEADIGYFLEVDLKYPEDLHDLHSDYPLALEKMLISHDMLSPYQQALKKELEYKPTKAEKLVPNLWDKEKYVIHYRNLKQYLNQGMKLQKIHRVLQFKQEPWLKLYIEHNTRLRAAACNDFEKDFFKLMNNSVFGKTMEDVRKRVNIKLVSEPTTFKKTCSQSDLQA